MSDAGVGQPDARQMPEPEKLLPQGGLTNKHKRWIFYACAGIVLLIVIANFVAMGPKVPQPANIRRGVNGAQQQNPTPAQIHEMESAFRIATRMAMLYEGKIIEEGEPEKFKQSKNPVVAQFLSGSTEGPILEGSLDAIRKK